MPQISRKEYSSLYGPTVGDRIRLGDTGLIIEIEKDLRGYGDESIYGGGKTLRAGMGGDSQSCRDNGVLDIVIAWIFLGATPMVSVTLVSTLVGIELIFSAASLFSFASLFVKQQ